MNSRFPLLWVLVFLFLSSSCKNKIIPVASAPELTNKEKVSAKNLNFDYFSAKGKMQVEGNGDKLSSSITMRIRKDSVIWISVVPALGIEVARIKITQDSVYLVNRLQKNYFAGDYSLIKQRFKVDVNFNLLQAILVGNYLPDIADQEKIIEQSSLQHSQQKQNNLIINQFLDVNNLKLKKLTIQDEDTNNTILVDYSQFTVAGNQPFAKTASIVIQQGESAKGTTATIDYSKIGVNEEKLSFPFSIPEGYSRK